MSPLRMGALLAGAAMCVHELRYAIGPGPVAADAPGHAYLPLAGVAAAVLIGAACALLLRAVLRAARTGAGESREGPFLAVWLLASASLVVIFFAQELLEGALAAGRPAGLGAIASSGGWLALPLSLALGALVALAMAGARAVVRAAARRGEMRPVRRRVGCGGIAGAHPAHRPMTPVLAAHLAGRAPPASL